MSFSRVLPLVVLGLAAPATAAQTGARVSDVDIRAESASLRSGSVRVLGQAGRATPVVSGSVTVWADVRSAITVPAPTPGHVETAAAEKNAEPPSEVSLRAVYPNPSAHAARVRYELPDAGHVRLTVYDALGREVLVAADGERPGGAHEAALDVGRLAPGVYHLRLSTGASIRTRSFVVSR